MSTTAATTRTEASSEPAWQSTACILCSLNCGIEVQAEDGHLVKIRADKKHPVSQGYQCQKASRLDFYQNGRDRLTSPLKRRPDGSFEEISWDQAVGEIANKLVQLRDTHGGHSMAYYGGGGQGNHMGGVYGSTLRAAMGTRYIYTSLAQEKTGGFWLNGKLFGHQTCHPSEQVEHSDYVVFIGTNPWQSHGFPQARKVLNEIARDPNRTMVVVDPRRTETAKKADVFLQVRPGGDAALLLAILGTIVQEGLEDQDFLRQRTLGWPQIQELLKKVDVEAQAEKAGVDVESLREVARGYAQAERGCLRTDLGLEHSPHSTLNLYLSKLLFLITGHFGKPGTVNLHSFLMPLIGHSKEPEQGGLQTRVTGMKEISKLFPPNVLPAEIDTDHPERIRGVFVDSANPLMTAADTRAYREAFDKLELLVVVDVAMTETARHAHYVLPASSQFEKWEATLFNLEFPSNFFHLRRPIFEPAPNTLPEPEIYRRIAVAMGALPNRFPVLEAIARLDRKMPKLRLFPIALQATLKLKPRLKSSIATILHETLGAAVTGADSSGEGRTEDARIAGAVWGACHIYAKKHAAAVRRAGIEDQGAGLGEALFQKILDSPAGTLLSTHTEEEMWSWIRHPGHKIHLVVDEMLEELAALEDEADATGADYPFVMMAGERRSFNANTIIRHNDWRKKDAEGALKLSPVDAESLGLAAGDLALCESTRGQVRVRVEITDELRPGVVSIPHGYGMVEEESQYGPAINELTDAERCDDVAKTPFHKFVPVRITPVSAEAVN